MCRSFRRTGSTRDRRSERSLGAWLSFSGARARGALEATSRRPVFPGDDDDDVGGLLRETERAFEPRAGGVYEPRPDITMDDMLAPSPGENDVDFFEDAPDADDGGDYSDSFEDSEEA